MPSSSEEALKTPENCSQKYSENRKVHQQTTYFQTLAHLFKANIGPACFAMGEAVKHSGLILGPILTIGLSIVCVFQQHVLIKCSDVMRREYHLEKRPDYAETLELSLISNEKWRNYSKTMKTTCNIFLIVTQLGFCSVYFLFVGNNVKNIFDFYGLECSLNVLMMFSLVPIIPISLITNLRYLAPFSSVANLCMFFGIIVSFFYSSQDLPSFSERKLMTSSLHELPLFFGTAIYLFEGIGLVLPLKNSMRKPEQFSSSLGVLNVGMTFLTILFTLFGFVGYWKYGDDVESSLTLNLPSDEWLAQSVNLCISIGVILGFAIQFFIPIQIMFQPLQSRFKFIDDHRFKAELIFRAIMVLVTFTVAFLVPNLGLLISLIGAVCSTSLALVFPVLIEHLVITRHDESPKTSVLIKNLLILFLAVVGFCSGGYESLRQIVRLYENKTVE